MNPHIFREYDIRGVVGRDLDEPTVERIGRGFGTLVCRADGRTVVVGRDCRGSSPALAAALAKGLASCGLAVAELGMVPTPVTYFESVRTGADGAVQVTGSHNPPDYNGLKLVLGQEAVYGAQIRAIRELIEAGDFERGPGSRTRVEAPDAPYVDWIVERAEMGAQPVKVVVDAGNGAGGPTALALYRRLGVEVIPLFCEPDGRFPNHHPDPTVPENLTALRQRVVEEGADFGIGFDGDADRIGVVDGSGDVLWGDQLMIVFARALLEEEPGAAIVAEVKCSQTLFDDIAARGGQPIMWKVGHSLIKAKMRETGAALAGEMSGHIFFKHRYLGFDDAIYAGVRLIELVSRDGRPLQTHLEGVPKTFTTPEIRVDTGDDRAKFAAATAVAESYRETPMEGVTDIVSLDGVRVVFEDGWGLVRASNTQPVVVLRAEATSKERLSAIESDLRARVDRALAERPNDEASRSRSGGPVG